MQKNFLDKSLIVNHSIIVLQNLPSKHFIHESEKKNISIDLWVISSRLCIHLLHLQSIPWLQQNNQKIRRGVCLEINFKRFHEISETIVTTWPTRQKSFFAFGNHLETDEKHFSKSHRQQFSKTFCTRRNKLCSSKTSINVRQFASVVACSRILFFLYFRRLRKQKWMGIEIKRQTSEIVLRLQIKFQDTCCVTSAWQGLGLSLWMCVARNRFSLAFSPPRTGRHITCVGVSDRRPPSALNYNLAWFDTLRR